jgi:hypothetical protein
MSDRPKPLRVRGHTLVGEGSRHDEYGGRISIWDSVYPDDKTGCGLCSCGEVSELLDSKNARMRWHRDHKLDLL